MTRYDLIGRTYTATRRPDPRIAARIDAALGDARTVVNVGAGAGSYEPRDRDVTAVEPSAVMRAQRSADAARCVDATAEALPFADGAFDAALAILTLHHWSDWRAGAAELRRVARAGVVLTWDPALAGTLWLVDEYLPELADDPFPPLEPVRAALDAEVQVVPVPHDCTDGFLGAHWRRPHAYLDPRVRAGMSVFATRDAIDLGQLERDLADGTWEARHRDLLDRTELDLGYRLLTWPSSAQDR